MSASPRRRSAARSRRSVRTSSSWWGRASQHAMRDVALLEFAYATGVRVSELVSLKLQDILFSDGVARVFGKGAKERIVPVGRRALGAVALYAREIRPTLDRGKTH